MFWTAPGLLHVSSPFLSLLSSIPIYKHAMFPLWASCYSSRCLWVDTTFHFSLVRILYLRPEWLGYIQYVSFTFWKTYSFSKVICNFTSLSTGYEGYTIWQFVYRILWSQYSSSLSNFLLDCFSSCIWDVIFFPAYKSFVKYTYCNTFSHSVSPFHFLKNIFQKVLNFHKVRFIIFKKF